MAAMASSRGVPSAASRLARDPSRLITVLLLAAVAATAPLLRQAIESGVLGTLSSNWRGAYDLLVLAEEREATPLLDAEGRELADPNFGNISADVIPNDLVERVAAAPGVEVSAPLGLVGRWANTMDWAFLSIPVSVFDGEPAQTFRIGWQVLGDDGLTPRLVQDSTDMLSIDMSGWDGSSEGLLGDVGIAVTSEVAGDGALADGLLTISWRPVPVAASTVFAVDPVAERELLGPESGEFLQPLIDAEALWNSRDRAVSAQSVAALDPGDPLRALLSATPEAAGPLSGMYGQTNPLTPYLRNSNAYPPMHLVATIDRLSEGQWSVIGTSEIDLAQARRPFAAASLRLTWPGSDATFPTYFTPADLATGVGSLELATAIPQDESENLSDAVVHLAAMPQGFVRPVPNAAQLPLDGAGLGQEQTYRQAGPATARLGTRMSSGAAPIEVGTYTPSAITVMRDGAAYVPLGAYDPARVRVGDNVLTPTLHGLGLAAQPSSALVSLEGARAFGVEDPVTAIRVRVAGISGYGPDALAKIAEVASDIEDLGLRVLVVAGSSPQDVGVWMTDYAFGTMDSGQPQRVADLGWAQVPFATLGVAAGVEHQVVGLASRLSGAATVIAGASLIAVAVLGLRTRRSGAQVLRASGWTRTQALRWYGSVDGVGLAIVLVGAGVGVGLTADWVPAAIALGGAAAASLLVLAIPLRMTSRTPRNRGATRLVGLGPVAVGVRSLRMGIATTVVRGVALAVVVCAVALGVGLVVGTTQGMRTTVLGAIAGNAVLALMVVTLALGAGCGLVLAWVTGALVRERGERRDRVLTHLCAWPRSWVRRTRAVGLVAVLLVGVLASAGVLVLTEAGVPREGRTLVPIVAAVSWLILTGVGAWTELGRRRQ